MSNDSMNQTRRNRNASTTTEAVPSAAPVNPAPVVNPTLEQLRAMLADAEKAETENKAKRAESIKASVVALCVDGVTAEEIAEIAAGLCGKTLRAVAAVNPEKPRGKPMALRNRIILAALAAEVAKGFAIGGVSADRLANDIGKLFPTLPAAREGEKATPVHMSEIKALRARIKVETATLPSTVVALETFTDEVTKALAVS